MKNDLTFSDSVGTALKQDKILLKKTAFVSFLYRETKESFEALNKVADYFDGDYNLYKEGMPQLAVVGKRYLEDDKTAAGALVLAAQAVLGPGFKVWEPDTIWHELETSGGLNIPAVNRDKLLAALTLMEVPAFYWEVNTFHNTVMCFNDVSVNIDIIQEARPAYLAWGVYEAQLILQDTDQAAGEFDYEPVLYTAECLHRDGFVLAPDILAFAQEALDKRNKGVSASKKKEIAEAWDKLLAESQQGKSLSDVNLSDDDPVDIQLAKLASCKLYLYDKLDAYKEALSKLKSVSL